jgi:FkbM family methyltransferase
MISPHYFTFPLYLPRICSTFSDWPSYLLNYLARRRRPAQYKLRNGTVLIDSTGTLAGTIAVVFVREEYGSVRDFRSIVDIGANMGCFAVYAAQQSPSARIFCYEPEAGNFTYLQRNISANSLENRITPFQAAVAARSGKMELSLGASPLHSLVKPEQGSVRQTVSCVTLGEILQRHQLETLDFLKMNCEGAEYEIFDSTSPKDLDRIANIRLEYHNLDATSKNGSALAKVLTNRGFQIERFSRYRDESGFIWAKRAK